MIVHLVSLNIIKNYTFVLLFLRLYCLYNGGVNMLRIVDVFIGIYRKGT